MADENQDVSSLPPSVSSAQGLELLQQQRKRGEKLLTKRPLNAEAHRAWEDKTREYLLAIFGSKSAHIGTILDAGTDTTMPTDVDTSTSSDERTGQLEQQLDRLNRLIGVLEEEVAFVASEPGASPVTLASREDVVLVYGRHEPTRRTVTAFLTQLELHVAVLDAPWDKDTPLLEKFGDYTDVGFAIVLLTAQERGGDIDATPEQQQLRASQSAILETGFLLGRLGRRRVCALYRENVELPAGILCIRLDDAGAWKRQLVEALQATGFAVDVGGTF